jgi:hypothetical protein
MGLEMDRHDRLPLQSAEVNPAEQRDAAAYVARHAQGDADRDLLMAALGLATPARTALLAIASTALIAAGWRLTRGGTS